MNPHNVLNSVSAKDFILEALYDNSVVLAAKKLGLEKKLLDPYVQNPVIENSLKNL